MKNQVQLITYVDRLGGGGLRELQALLDGPLHGVFGAVHLLPFFHPIDGADAGFDPIDHLRVDERLGSWDDIAALAAECEPMADVIVNHVSSQSMGWKNGSRCTPPKRPASAPPSSVRSPGRSPASRST